MVAQPLPMTETEEGKIKEFIRKKISDQTGGLTMRELLKLASEEKNIANIEERDRIIRHILRQEEETGDIYADWSWKYRIAQQ